LAEPIRENLKTQRRTAILVSVPDPSRNLDKDHALDELRGLAKTAGVLACQEDAFTLACYAMGDDAQAEQVVQTAVKQAYW